ncbi:hypothetical protein M422DRAFT_56154 [Sphaerobolus stellatus SS14]|uniref:Uncharacterized protein n=1 Tax=Sphaerobolus stellatus (strain SS14) TaxID=990650 RepID=A0A0C9TT31_SPHS4|nr:hypothetical protein M422DRAFT_56154 [Sphaerobolus stellatus SS14]
MLFHNLSPNDRPAPSDKDLETALSELKGLASTGISRPNSCDASAIETAIRSSTHGETTPLSEGKSIGILSDYDDDSHSHSGRFETTTPYAINNEDNIINPDSHSLPARPETTSPYAIDHEGDIIDPQLHSPMLHEPYEHPFITSTNTPSQAGRLLNDDDRLVCSNEEGFRKEINCFVRLLLTLFSQETGPVSESATDKACTVVDPLGNLPSFFEDDKEESTVLGVLSRPLNLLRAIKNYWQSVENTETSILCYLNLCIVYELTSFFQPVRASPRLKTTSITSTQNQVDNNFTLQGCFILNRVINLNHANDFSLGDFSNAPCLPGVYSVLLSICCASAEVENDEIYGQEYFN